MRITRKILNNKLKVLVSHYKRDLGHEIGNLNMDYIQCYGGYKIVEYGENGSEHHPFLQQRLTAQNMSLVLDMAIAMIRQHQSDMYELTKICSSALRESNNDLRN